MTIEAPEEPTAGNWMDELDLFKDPKHQPYTWENGAPAALLIHGFPGTPMETRSLGTHLHNLGWTVKAPLLPGFGTDFSTLFERRHEEWIEAAVEALRDLRTHHSPILIMGHSMGGAVALNVAAESPPDGLVLLAPFWRLPLSSRWQRAISPILRLFVRKTRPFRNIDFTHPDVKEAVEEFMPELDLDDPEVREKIRETTVPTRIFEELEALGRKAYAAARRVPSRTLIIQGLQDELVKRELTRDLLTHLEGPVEYHEVPAEHDLLRPKSAARDQVKSPALAFAKRLIPPEEGSAPS